MVQNRFSKIKKYLQKCAKYFIWARKKEIELIRLCFLMLGNQKISYAIKSKEGTHAFTKKNWLDIKF